ncbi:MAG TPA: hypothetical protein VJ499_16925 [Flavisolibacter sp.]|nr:hypothetical protein [Flavisolibacter sp.]
MKKITIILSILGLIMLSAYMYLRNTVSTPGFQPAPAKSPANTTKKAESVADLRPMFITKLQQLVKAGSGGLYNLSIHEVEPDVLNATVSINNAELVPDSAVLQQLRNSGGLPSQVFKVRLGQLKIEGLGLKDFLDAKSLDLKSIKISAPSIDVYPGSSSGPGKKAPTLYQGLKEKLEHLGIDHILIDGGKLVIHQANGKVASSLEGVQVRLGDLLMDSTTQYDKKRFLFAKNAELSMKNYRTSSKDGMYDMAISEITVNPNQSFLSANHINLKPRLGKKEFAKKQGVMKERYDISIPSLHMQNIDWWSLVNQQKIFADEAEISNARFSIYFDRSLPPGKPKLNSFPSQLVMKMPVMIHIARLKCNNMDLQYEEYNPFSKQTGNVHITRLNGEVQNLTNVPSVIQKNKETIVKANGMVLGNIPAKLILHFDMARYKKGAFTADINVKSFDGSVIKPISEPLGLFRLKSGSVQSITAHQEGDQAGATGKTLILYKDLKITPLEKGKGDDDSLNKKHVTGFIANAFIIKNDNPSGKEEARNPVTSATRDPHGSFFNLIWKTLLTGILKTTGAPEKLAKPKYYTSQ